MRNTLIGFLFACITLWAQAPLAILQDGRIQPMDSYARRLLVQWSGRESFEGRSAERVLRTLAQDPDSAGSWSLFLVNRSDVAEALGLEGGRKRRYTYQELQSGRYRLEQYAFLASKDSSVLQSAFGREMQRLYAGILVYESWSRALQPLRGTPLSPLRTFMELPRLIRLQTTDSVAQLQIAELYLYTQSMQPDPVVVLPPMKDRDWSSLGQLLYAPAAGEDFRLQLLSTVHPRAYFASAQALQESLPNAVQQKLKLELMYNKARLFDWARALLMLGGMAGLVALARRRPWLGKVEIISLVTALLLSVLGIVIRSVVAQRPPVSNLYESLLFVATIAVAMGLFLRVRARWSGGGIVGALGAIVLLSVARGMAWEKDSLGVLAAVLDSNLWLSAHVLTIALGYAGILCAGLIGHAWLWSRWRGLPVNTLNRLRNLLYGTLGFGLLFTFVGTVLGGIWADQSWGRFWGWDPKENGALLLILWLAILFHARKTQWLGDRGVALGAVWGLVLLVLAWFGVNMLGVGLHAYGRGTGGLWLVYYVIGQSLLAFLLGVLTRMRATV